MRADEQNSTSLRQNSMELIAISFRIMMASQTTQNELASGRFWPETAKKIFETIRGLSEVKQYRTTTWTLTFGFLFHIRFIERYSNL